MPKLIPLFLCCLLFVGCSSPEKQSYSFFVAGHTYGSPVDYQGGIYAPFLDDFESLNADEQLKMGFFTGDIVQRSTTENWNLVERDLEALNQVDLHFVPGNHDIRDNDLFWERWPEPYSFFTFEQDAFVLLDANADHWNISGDQLQFLKENLENLPAETDHVFLFVHQLIFADLFDVEPNSWEGKADTLNFETAVLPLLKATEKPVYIFAGDVGAMNWGTALFHEKINNVTCIASGMGGENGDNYLKVNVSPENGVSIEIISLDGTQFGPITDY